MYYEPGRDQTPDLFQPLPDLPEAAFEGVRTRRILAIGIDLVFITLMTIPLGFLLIFMGFPTLGLTWLFLPILYPFVALLYNGLSISGPRRATPGMYLMDLEMRLTNGAPVPFLLAVIHAVLYYVSWILTPFILGISLFTRGKRCLHDILSNIVIIRRPI